MITLDLTCSKSKPNSQIESGGQRLHSKMRILIDATGVRRQKAGVGVYARNLIDKLTVASRDAEFYILAQDDDPELDFSGRPSVTMIRVPAKYFRHLPLRFLLEQCCLPVILWWRKIDVIHSLHYSFPCLTFGTRRVVTIHDMTFFSMPEVHERLKVIYFRFFIRAAIRSAEGIIFISRSVQEDCIGLLGEPFGLYRVILHGRDESLKPQIDNWRMAQIRQKYGVPDRFILYIGTIEPRKNLERLVTAFEHVAATDARIVLVIVGKMGWKISSLSEAVGRLGLNKRVVFTGFILEEEKLALLTNCDVFVYPSLYEGFGLPVLEALACGAPTVTSNVSSLPEIVKDAAIVIDPLDTFALASAMRSLLNDNDLQEKFRTRGPERAELFSWIKTAENTADLYRSIRSVAGLDRSLADY